MKNFVLTCSYLSLFLLLNQIKQHFMKSIIIDSKKDTLFRMRVSSQTKSKIRAMAKQRETTLSGLIRQLIEKESENS